MTNFADAINLERDQASEEKLLQEPARRAWEKIKEVPKNKEQYSKRWLWELIQNASDRTEKVDVRIELHNDILRFTHNGPFFRATDIDNLIRPFSGKIYELDKSNVIGQYGTGFLSTHILSGRIKVNCRLQNEANPSEVVESQFELDRRSFLDWQNSATMIREIQRSIEQSRTYVHADTQNRCHSFTYYFDSPLSDHIDCKSVALVGIDYAKRVLPYVMTFISRINSVQVVDARDLFDGQSVWRIVRKESSKTDEFCFEISEQMTPESEVKSFIRRIRKRTLEGLEAAYEVSDNRVVPYPEDMPRLFLGFPMIGSEHTGLPVVVNSFHFEPSGTERSYITLTEGDAINRKLLINLNSIYKGILDECAAENLLDAYWIARCKPPSDESVFPGTAGLEWYRNCVSKPISNTMVSAKIVQSRNGFKAANELKFPQSQLNDERTEDWYDKLSTITSKDLVIKTGLRGWLKVVPKDVESEYVYTENRFLKIGSENPTRFTDIGDQDVEKFHAYRDLILFIVECEGVDLLNKYTSIPDLSRHLRKLNEPLQVSHVTEPLLIAAYNDLEGKCYEQEVLHPDFAFVAEHLSNRTLKTNETLAKSIDDELEGLRKSGTNSKPLLDALVAKLFSWSNEKWSSQSEQSKRDWLKAHMPWFHRNRATLYFERFDESLRNELIAISESVHLKSFSTILNSGIDHGAFERIVNRLPLVLALLDEIDNSVDDEAHADPNLGELGEELVYNDLKRKFPQANVIWASKHGEPSYDFKIEFPDQRKMYIDAKATRGTYSNSESNPIFIRNSQWRFLKANPTESGYHIARVFLGSSSVEDTPCIEYLRLEVSSLA